MAGCKANNIIVVNPRRTKISRTQIRKRRVAYVRDDLGETINIKIAKARRGSNFGCKDDDRGVQHEVTVQYCPRRRTVRTVLLRGLKGMGAANAGREREHRGSSRAGETRTCIQ